MVDNTLCVRFLKTKRTWCGQELPGTWCFNTSHFSDLNSLALEIVKGGGGEHQPCPVCLRAIAHKMSERYGEDYLVQVVHEKEFKRKETARERDALRKQVANLNKRVLKAQYEHTSLTCTLAVKNQEIEKARVLILDLAEKLAEEKMKKDQ